MPVFSLLIFHLLKKDIILPYIIAEPPESKFNLLDFWGDYAANSLYRWRKKNAEIEIISSDAPGGERFTLYFMF